MPYIPTKYEEHQRTHWILRPIPHHPSKKKDIFQDFNFGGINYVITYNYGDNYSPYISIDPVRSRTNFVATQPHHTFTHCEFVN